LADVAPEVHAVGDHWQEVARLFSEAAGAPDAAPKLEEVSTYLLAIADCEQDVWGQLQRLSD
jgi:hypothetical protein